MSYIEYEINDIWTRIHQPLTASGTGDRKMLTKVGRLRLHAGRPAMMHGHGKETMTASVQLSMSKIDQLVAVEEIKGVKNKYALSADQHAWDDFASVFAPDAIFDESNFPTPQKPFTNEPAPGPLVAYLESKASSGVNWPLIGREAIRAQHLGIPIEHNMVHHLLNPDVVLTSDTTADAVFRFESHHWLPAGGPVRYMHNFGSYHETYVRLDDGRWYIKTLRRERRRVECIGTTD